jgi:hypothetical protein
MSSAVGAPERRPARVRGEKVASWPFDRPLRWRLDGYVQIRGRFRDRWMLIGRSRLDRETVVSGPRIYDPTTHIMYRFTGVVHLIWALDPKMDGPESSTLKPRGIFVV